VGAFKRGSAFPPIISPKVESTVAVRNKKAVAITSPNTTHYGSQPIQKATVSTSAITNIVAK